MKLLLILFATIVLPITLARCLGVYIGKKLGPKVQAWQEAQQLKLRPELLRRS